MTHASNWRTRRYKPLQRERLIVVRQSWPRGLYTPWQRSRSGPARLSLLWARGPLVALTPTTDFANSLLDRLLSLRLQCLVPAVPQDTDAAPVDCGPLLPAGIAQSVSQPLTPTGRCQR